MKEISTKSLPYQGTDPSIIMQLHDQGASSV